MVTPLCVRVVRLPASVKRKPVSMPLLVQYLHKLDGKFQLVHFGTLCYCM